MWRGVFALGSSKHIEEESGNLKKMDSSQFYKKVMTPTLILRATKGMLAADDLVLPADVAERMFARYLTPTKWMWKEAIITPSCFSPPIRSRSCLDFWDEVTTTCRSRE